MKKYFFTILLGVILILPFGAEALTSLPITISDNAKKLSSINNEVIEGEYVLPEFCSNDDGCTITFDAGILKQIGKYDFSSGQEYFFIFEGTGVTIYEESGPNQVTAEVYAENFNKIVFNPATFTDKIVIQTGSGDEARMIIFIPTITDIPSEDTEPLLSDDINDTSNINLSRLKDYSVFIICGVAIVIILIVLTITVKKRNKVDANKNIISEKSKEVEEKQIEK